VPDHSDVDCTRCCEALSARLDGEESAAEREEIDAHLATCIACRQFADQAAHVTRLARTGVATQEPDIVEAVLAVAPRSRRPQLSTALRVLLGLVGLAQIEVAFVGVLGAHNSVHSAQGVVLQGASVTHFAHESAAWNLALGVGFLWVARRSSRTSGMVPMLATFMVVLTVLVVMDVVAGGVDAVRLLGHGLVLLGLILVIVLDRLPRPAGRTTLRRSTADVWTQQDPASTAPTDDGLPPDLRPTAQQDGTVIVHRRIA
jgi:predicted anti-sigma-YlaC factor YlaD